LHTFHGLQAPWPFRYGKGRKEAEYTKDLLAHAEKVICSAGNRLAAIVIEPIGGATGGVVLPPAGYLTGLQRLCQANGALLVLDEVMTGLWRTGTPLAGAHWDLRPDIVTLGKGLGAGYTPIAATLLASRVTDAIRSGSGRVLQGHTYAGNPLGSAVALAVLQRLDELRIPDRIPVTGRHLLTELERLAQSHRLIAEVRGLGLLAGLELADSADAPAVVGALTGLLVEAAAGEGLLVYPASGGINDAILVAPPLTVSDEQVDEIATKLDRALSLVEMHLESVRGLPRLACSLR
jgi:adenosylmethionine-8-amino-7-oxononanoate aminotransferase